MNIVLKSAIRIGVCAVLSVALSAYAITLGKARGSVILGQPLLVSVAVQSVSQDDSDAECFSAEVYYGDIRVTDDVTLTARQNAAGAVTEVKVSASSPVSEPIVSVHLKSVCGTKSARTYHFFAEVASELDPTVNTGKAKSAASNSLVAPLAKSNQTWATEPGTVISPTQSGPAAQAAAVSAPVSAAHPGKPNRRSKVSELGAKASAGPKEANMVSSVPASATVGPSSAEVNDSVEELKKRVEALDAWQAANSNAQDVLKDSARWQSLESDIKGLKTLANRNRQVLESANERLDKIEVQRYSSWTVYGLLAALTVAMAGVAALWLRTRHVTDGADTPWWASEHQTKGAVSVEVETGVKESVEVTADYVATGHPSSHSKIEETAPSENEARPSQLDIDISLGESIFSKIDSTGTRPIGAGKADAPHLTDGPAAGRRDFVNSGLGTIRALNTKEMLDVRQQAEFFMTLGQHDEAIKILENSINASNESNPLIYLDLLKLFHTLSKKNEFEKYRAEFNLQFTGVVPAYGNFNASSASLADYPELCERLVELWSTPEAVDYIEYCLVRSSAIPENEGLDLEAFRDLLMLHGVIRRLESMEDSGMVPFSAPKALIPPVFGSDDSKAGIVSFQKSEVQPLPAIEAPSLDESLDIPLDLDLSEKEDAPDNLIEFDISGYTQSLGKDKPPSGA